MAIFPHALTHVLAILALLLLPASASAVATPPMVGDVYPVADSIVSTSTPLWAQLAYANEGKAEVFLSLCGSDPGTGLNGPCTNPLFQNSTLTLFGEYAHGYPASADPASATPTVVLLEGTTYWVCAWAGDATSGLGPTTCNRFSTGYAQTDLVGNPTNGTVGWYGDGTGNYYHGMDGTDTLYGEAGADTLWGDTGDDALWGGLDWDQLYGGDGTDSLWGEIGADFLWGETGADFLWGGLDNDLLWGGLDWDQLHGGDGNDEASGDDGNDSLWGDDGDDALWGDSADGTGCGNDLLWGGSGFDQLYGGCGWDILHGDEYADDIFGGANADTLYGEGGADDMSGGAGNDSMSGGPGNDTLDGGSGNDYINAGYGNDNINAGYGNDIVRANQEPATRSLLDLLRSVRRRDTVNCGPGRRDVAYVNSNDIVRNCEVVRFKRFAR